MHRVSLERLPEPPGPAVIGGEEAYHAVVVKRLEVGERLELIDGRGGMARATITAIVKSKKAPEFTVSIESVTTQSRPAPLVSVWSAVPKGDRAGAMIDGLAQVGADCWGPLETVRGVAEATAHKVDRLERIAVESSKQCGRAWHLSVESRERTISEMLTWAKAPRRGLIIADASGGPPAAALTQGKEEVALLVGPEGGWTPDELRILTAGGATAVCFGPYVMRIEVAAVAAVSQLRRMEGR